MTDEERRQRAREYYRKYRKENKAKIDKYPSRRKNYEEHYADLILKQTELIERRREWEV